MSKPALKGCGDDLAVIFATQYQPFTIDMAAIIKVENLSKNFGEIKAVDHISFTVEEGDVYGFLGQNGAGKSTTIRMLLTLIQPGSGNIQIFGKNLSEQRKAILSKTGAVIEKPDLYKYLTALENLSLFAKLSGLYLKKDELMRQLHRVGLAERAHHKVKTYSQGMKQRLGIAVALVHDPQLIILDEPTNGLDPQGIADIRNLIIHLSRDLKKTVLVSSHLLSEVEQIASRMLIIDKGKKLVEGEVRQLLDPEHVVTEIGTTDDESALLFIRQSEWNNFLQSSNSRKMIFELHKNQVPLLNKELVDNGIGILSIQRLNSLEEYFLSLTSGKQNVEINTDRTV
ncbi:MAG: ABC transporter ATP-binding protein [Chitinophagaceae bacterium]|nr:ABC transporter ATP-binding protein [Chitinophagaceae bacterium]